MFNKKYLLPVLLSFIIFLVSGCGDKDINDEEKNEPKSQNDLMVESIAQKYNASVDWDEGLDNLYTYQVKKTLVGTKIAFANVIDDVWQEGGKMYIGLSDYRYNYVLEIESNKLKILETSFGKCEWQDELAIVAQVDDVNSLKFAMTGYPIGSGDDAEVEISLDPSDIKVIKGKLIDANYIGCEELMKNNEE